MEGDIGDDTDLIGNNENLRDFGEDDYTYHEYEFSNTDDEAIPVLQPAKVIDRQSYGLTRLTNPTSVTGRLLNCCCGDSCWRPSEAYDKEAYPLIFRGKHFVGAIVGIFSYYYDVMSDIVLAKEYYLIERWIAFWFTASFILFPMLIINVINIHWYCHDYNRERIRRKSINPIPWLLRILCSIPLISGPVVRTIEYIYHGWKSRSMKTKDRDVPFHYKQMLFKDADAAMLNMLEAFMEAAPQLVLQTCIILTEVSDGNTSMHIVRGFAMFGSWIGLAGSLVTYTNSVRSSNGQSMLTPLGTALYYLWRAFEVGPRVIVFAAFATEFKYYMLLGVLAPHWIMMAVWVARSENPNSHKTLVQKFFFGVVMGYVLLFCFQNVQECSKRLRARVYYGITFSQNVAMYLAWLFFTKWDKQWYFYPIVIFVPTCMVLQLIVQCTYYNIFKAKYDHTISCQNYRKAL